VRDQLALVDDDHVRLGGAIDDLLSRVRAASALDQVERGVDFICAVDAHVELPGARVVEQRDAAALRQATAGSAGRNARKAATAAHELTHGLDEKACGRAGAQTQDAACG
jgi:hypothetical protein